ncbi:MAG: WbqC family protein, partial [bacterium]
MKKIIITQSNYIPWKGYFDSINTADEFILYD